MVVSLIAIGAIVFLFLKIKENEKTLALSFSLILSGAVGNLIDRLRYGEVVDFLDFHLSTTIGLLSMLQTQPSVLVSD